MPDTVARMDDLGMIDWDEVIKAEDPEELKEAKLWLFRENVRIQNEKKELDASRDKFLQETTVLRKELDELSRKTMQEQKRLREENLFFDKKMDILKAGFLQLEQDRKALERERKTMRENANRISSSRGGSMEETVEFLFRNVGNSLALRKRYRDLVKIFHPDNLFGDAELMQSINKEFLKRKDRF